MKRIAVKNQCPDTLEAAARELMVAAGVWGDGDGIVTPHVALELEAESLRRRAARIRRARARKEPGHE